MDIQIVFNHFCNQLRNRTGFLSEDNVRYYWFVSMMQQAPNINNYTLEHPYPDLKNKEMDLLYNDAGNIFCFEIKFHRNRGKSTFPHTDAAGELFNDLLRLRSYHDPNQKSIRRFLLYVADQEMDQYLNGKGNTYRNELQKFYNMGSTCTSFHFSLSQDAPITFLKRANTSLENVSITKLVSLSIRLLSRFDFPTSNESFKGGQCHVRLYELCNNNDKLYRNS